MQLAGPFRATPNAACRRPGRMSVVVRAEAITVPAGTKQIHPRGDRVLVKVAEEQTKTAGGILLPTAAIKRPTSGEVVALGDGRVNGKTREFYLKNGETVLYSKHSFMYTELKLGEQSYILIREGDVIGIMPKSDARMDDIPELKPMNDRVLVKVDDAADVTLGGVFLPDSAKERPLCGTVVAVGPGKVDEDKAQRKAPLVKAGDKVLYFKYAGDNMETSDGIKYVVLREDDILCKA